MSNLPVDRDANYMKEMWGTTKLVTDYDPKEKITLLEADPLTCGGSHFTHGHGFFTERANSSEKLKKQSEMHEKIRNQEDYDDWEYGTEPSYGKRW